MSFPISPEAKTISITGVAPTMVSTTHNLTRQVRSKGAQRWMIDATFAPMTREQFAPIWAFSNHQRGQFKTFIYYPPIWQNSSGSAVGNLATTSDYTAGTTSGIAYNGLSSGTLKAGDFIKFASHDKVYCLIYNSNTTLHLEPPLIQDITSGDVVSFNDVGFTVSFSSDQQVMSLSNTQLVGFSIKLVEVA